MTLVQLSKSSYVNLDDIQFVTYDVQSSKSIVMIKIVGPVEMEWVTEELVNTLEQDHGVKVVRMKEKK